MSAPVRTRWLSVASAAVLLVVAGAGVALSRIERSAPAVPSALASMPAETLIASVTDWARARDTLGGARRAPGAFLDRAYETDASAVTVLGEMVPVMEDRYGWSVLDAQWEALAQSRRGAALVVQLPPGFDLARVRRGLADLGYQRPSEPDEVWRGGPDLVAGIDPTLTPLMSHAAVLDESRRVVFSDTVEYAGRTARVTEGSVRSLSRQPGVAAAGDRLSGAVAAVVRRGRHACRVMGFGRAAAGDQAAARQRVRAVGGVGRYSTVGLGLMPGPDGGLRRAPLLVAMEFPDSRSAAGEAVRRARLAVGDAPGQGGSYGSRFGVAAAWQRGGEVVLRLRPREVDQQLLSDLNAGELLFASCG